MSVTRLAGSTRKVSSEKEIENMNRIILNGTPQDISRKLNIFKEDAADSDDVYTREQVSLLLESFQTRLVPKFSKSDVVETSLFKFWTGMDKGEFDKYVIQPVMEYFKGLKKHHLPTKNVEDRLFWATMMIWRGLLFSEAYELVKHTYDGAYQNSMKKP